MANTSSSDFHARAGVFTAVYLAIAWLVPLHGTSSASYLIGSILSGYLFALVLGYLLGWTRLTRPGRPLAFWRGIFVVQMLNPLIEGYLFTDQFMGPSMFIGAVIFSVAITFVYALTAGLLFSGAETDRTLRSELRALLSAVKGWSWLRLPLVAIS